MNAQLRTGTPASPDLAGLLARQRAAHAANPPDYAQRIDDLKRLRAAFKAALPSLVEAVAADFGRRSRHESLIADGMTVLHDIDYALSNLRHWMKPQPARVGTTFWPARAEVRHQPLGVIGVISPWNYPVNLALMPVTAALAAGNHVMLKPSEQTPRTSAAIAKLCAALFPPERVAVIEGDASVAQAFSELPFDHIFFTGSTAVGRLVMMAAAKNLVPVTLELGGKSPAILAPDFSVETFANRIATGKFFNAGQTCIAPDYVLLPRAQVEPFLDALRRAVVGAYDPPGA
ncbi:MAG TPA: aldehyde dehydrogenase family protein, partial [Xanthomonadales bacterium]|nr:aldehyde dehydrogenase family protein [Xanthomonadales bacterium]